MMSSQKHKGSGLIQIGGMEIDEPHTVCGSLPRA